MDVGRILITGATGFLGSEILRQALAEGLPVRAMHRSLPSGVPRTSRRFPQAEWCYANLMDIDSLRKALNGVEIVIHAAGLAHVFNNSNLLEDFTRNNAEGTANIALAAGQTGVKHLVLVSSVSVYGGNGAGGCTEDSSCGPTDPYSASKYEAEIRAIENAEKFGMSLTILRMATIYGEDDPGNVGRLLRAIDRHRFLWVGNGSNRKSLIQREDAARACLVAAVSPASCIRTYNVSSPPCLMRDIVNGLAAALKRPVPQWHIPGPFVLKLSGWVANLPFLKRYGSNIHKTVSKWLCDDVYPSGKFEAEFGFAPRVGLAEGLERMVRAYRERYR